MPTVQALNAGATLTDSFTASTADGTAQVVTITIDGANDAAVITGDITGSVVEAGGVANGTPGTPFVVGDLDAADVDNPPDSWTASTRRRRAPTATAPSRSMQRACGSTCSTTAMPAVQALNVGQTLTDTFTATTVDGTAQLVTITINGANDAAVITGAVTGTVVGGRRRRQRHAGHPDRDRRSPLHRRRQSERRLARGQHAGAASANGYGSYTLTAAGVWTYTLDNSNADGAGAQCRRHADRHASRSTTVDGTAQLVTVTINGANDAAVIAGDATGSRDRGRRRRQRHAGHADRHRRSELDRRRQSG